ncbi:MAG: sugar phosphate isomerase/epimerase family protein [Anaerolineae bacterium]
MSKVPVALQLYTVRDETAKDFSGTVRKVAEVGYVGIELAGTGGLSAEEMRALLDETGLKLAGNHLSVAALETGLDEVITYNKTIGARYVGISALPGDMRNPQGYEQAAALMNRVGADLQQAGLALYYHNHNFEFESVDGVRGIDVLMGQTDPDIVHFELDVYWAAFAGADPAAFIRGHAGRFPLIHLKDMAGAAANRTFMEIGEGTLDFEPIFEAAEAQGAVWYIVEQDTCQRPSLESAALSLQNLRKWGKV